MASAAIVALAPDPGEADIAWVVTGEFCEPETVLPLPDNTLLVSNVCGIHATGPVPHPIRAGLPHGSFCCNP